MRIFLPFLVFGFAIVNLNLFAQKNTNIAVIGFYNVENLFDTDDDPITNDSQFLPNGDYQWTPERYQTKLENLSKVISLIAKEKGGVALLGLSEIENEKVMNDLVQTEKLKPFNFGVVHHDSPDRRGVDVGLIYQKDRFRVLGQKAYELKTNDTNFITRDQLLITGIIDGTDTLHIIVNHWPSKIGGEKLSMPKRIAAALLSRHIADSLMAVNPLAKVIIMGDLNDNPNSKSITEYLKAKHKISELMINDLYNPMWKLYRDGIGSYAYRDSWDMIDNIIISYGLVNPPEGSYKYSGVDIFRAGFLLTPSGSFIGYPYRTYAGGSYIGGYSDHLPVFITIQK